MKDGKLKEANAAWWGFNEADSTAAIQDAIDSGAPKVVIPNVGKPWTIRPVRLRSHLKLVFEPGVEVIAKKGEFLGKHDSMFHTAEHENITLVGYGATLRMRKADYTAEPYPKADWRMGLLLRSCRNVKIYGLTIAETGGDGIYLGRHGDRLR